MRWFDVDNRSIKILRLLEQRQVISNDLLIEALEVSAKTIKNDVRDINEEFKGCAVIDLKQGIYKLYITDMKKYEGVKSRIESQNGYFESPQMRMSFIVDTLMNSSSPYLMDELAYAMNIGRSTLVGDIKKLKEILRLYDLQIIGKTNTGLMLEGEELNLRFFILENNYSIIYDEDFLDEDIVEIVKAETAPYLMDSMAITHFLKFLTLSLDRLLHNHPVQFSDAKYQELLTDFSYGLVNSIVEKIEDNLHIALSTEERLFLAIPFVGMRTPTVIDGIEKKVQISDDIIGLVQEVINLIQQEMGLTVKFTEVLDEFIYHIYFMLNRLRYGFRLYNPMIRDIQEKYGMAYKMAILAKKVIEEKMAVILPQDEVGFLAAYFEIFISEQRIAQKENYAVAVVCGTGRAAARLVLNQLKSIFDSNTQLDMYSDNQANEEILDRYDLVISTLRMAFHTLTPVIYLDEIFDEAVLKKRIDSVRYIKKLDIPVLQGMESLLLSILDENTFFVLDSSLSYEENVHIMIDRIYEGGYVDSEFKQRIDEREKKSSMVFDESVAFPHGYHFQSSKVVICVGVLQEGIKTGKYKDLKIIFLVALPQGNEDDVVLVQIYDELIAISNNKEVVDAVSKVDSYQDFLMYFIKNCELFG